MAFEKHFRSVFKAAPKRLRILWKSWRVFHERSLLGRCLGGFVLQVLQYCSQFRARLPIHTLIKLLYRVVSGARFLTEGVLVCDIADHRSVAVVKCMMYKIGCNQMHPLYGALPGPYGPVRVTRGALVAYRYTYAPPRCRTLQYRRTFIPLLVPLWNDLADSVFAGVRLAGFKSMANAFFISLSCSIFFCLYYFSPFSLCL